MEKDPKDPIDRKASRNKRRIRMLKYWHGTVLVRGMALIIVAFIVINLITPNRTFSANENRNLAQRPKMTLASLRSGDYFRDFSSYLTDQFFGRDAWLSLNFTEQKVIGRKESGGVYLGKDHYLLAKPAAPDEDAVGASEKAIRDFASAYPDVKMNMMLVPCAAAVNPSVLPDFAPVRDQKKDITSIEQALEGSGITFTDPSKTLADHFSEGVYYKTDHHWTTRGAWYAFAAAQNDLGLSDQGIQFKQYIVSQSFQGTLASQSGSHGTKDTIEVYAPQNVYTEYYVHYPDTGENVTSVYDSSKLKEKDQYQVFFGGNHPLVEIHTANKTSRNIMIFKDSYANCFVPFMLSYYDNIYMIDPRYYYDDISTLMTSDGITDVLFLYSENTFAEDTTLTDVLENAVSGAGTQGTSQAGTAAQQGNTQAGTAQQSDAQADNTQQSGTQEDNTQQSDSQAGTAQQNDTQEDISQQSDTEGDTQQAADTDVQGTSNANVSLQE